MSDVEDLTFKDPRILPFASRFMLLLHGAWAAFSGGVMA